MKISPIKTLRAIRRPREVLPALAAIAFQRKRWIPEIEWSHDGCWTHNVFMVYHQIFGKACHTDGGKIRPASVEWWDENGKHYRKAFTIEQACAFIEGDIRLYFREVKKVERNEAGGLVLSPLQIQSLQKVGYATLAVLGSFFVHPGLILIPAAIAFDQITQLTTQAPSAFSGNATTSGSNRFIVAIPSNGSTPTITAITYAAVSMTLGQNYGTQTGTQGYYHQAYWQANPTTGTNTFSFTWTGGGNGFAYVYNYTGVTNTGASSQAGIGISQDQAYSGTSCFATGTVPSSNGWVVFGGSGNGSLGTGVYNSVGTQRTSNGVTWMFGDSNGTVAAGSYTCGYTNSSGTSGSLIAFNFGADAPAAAVVAGGQRPLIGVGA